MPENASIYGLRKYEENTINHLLWLLDPNGKATIEDLLRAYRPEKELPPPGIYRR